jgi:hypothetical protein
MTQQDYDNDLVFRSGGEEYARVDGNGEWKPRTPATKLEIRANDNDEDVTELVKHAAELVEGITITTEEGGSIKPPPLWRWRWVNLPEFPDSSAKPSSHLL